MEELYTRTIKLVLGPPVEEDGKRVVEVSATSDLIDLRSLIQDPDRIRRRPPVRVLRRPQFEKPGQSPRRRRRLRLRAQKQESLDTQLKQIFPLGRSKQFYMFDFGDSWTFAISRGTKKQHVAEGVEYPRLVEEEGSNPRQYPNWDDE